MPRLALIDPVEKSATSNLIPTHHGSDRIHHIQSPETLRFQAQISDESGNPVVWFGGTIKQLDGMIILVCGKVIKQAPAQMTNPTFTSSITPSTRSSTLAAEYTHGEPLKNKNIITSLLSDIDQLADEFFSEKFSTKAASSIARRIQMDTSIKDDQQLEKQNADSK